MEILLDVVDGFCILL